MDADVKAFPHLLRGRSPSVRRRETLAGRIGQTIRVVDARLDLACHAAKTVAQDDAVSGLDLSCLPYIVKLQRIVWFDAIYDFAIGRLLPTLIFKI
jgi:hypothetical protein